MLLMAWSNGYSYNIAEFTTLKQATVDGVTYELQDCQSINSWLQCAYVDVTMKNSTVSVKVSSKDTSNKKHYGFVVM